MDRFRLCGPKSAPGRGTGEGGPRREGALRERRHSARLPLPDGDNLHSLRPAAILGWNAKQNGARTAPGTEMEGDDGKCSLAPGRQREGCPVGTPSPGTQGGRGHHSLRRDSVQDAV